MAKWTDDLHRVFVELCAVEVLKGNRVGSTLSKEGWSMVEKEFTRLTKMAYTHKQFKNHWEKMKGEYKIFKKLKWGESGLGWNEATKTIDAAPILWLQMIQENPKIAQFKNKDLSLIMQYYDTLFGDIVPSGERAKAPNTYSAAHLEEGEEFTEMFGVTDDGKEGSGDSDDNPVPSPCNLFPSSSLKSGKSSGSKRKKSGAEFVREGLEGLAAAMSCRSTQSTAANEDAEVNAAIDLLDSMEQLVPAGSDLYYYAGQHIRDKINRKLFLKARNNDIRYGQLQFHFNLFKAAGN